MKDFFKSFIAVMVLLISFLPYVADEEGVYHLFSAEHGRGFYRTCLFKELIRKIFEKI